MATDRYVLVICPPCACINSRSLADGVVDVHHLSLTFEQCRVNQELDPASWFSTRIQQLKSSTFNLLQFCCWNTSQLESHDWLDQSSGSGILASALLPHPHPHPHRSGSDSGHAKPHPHPRCSSFKFELAQAVRQMPLPLATDLPYARSASRSMLVVCRRREEIVNHRSTTIHHQATVGHSRSR